MGLPQGRVPRDGAPTEPPGGYYGALSAAVAVGAGTGLPVGAGLTARVGLTAGVGLPAGVGGTE